MTIKATMLFQQVSNFAAAVDVETRVGGWSESYYADTSLAETQTNFFRLCQSRAKLLSVGARVVGQRFQIVAGGSATTGRTFIGSAGLQADVPQMGLLCTAANPSFPNVRRFTLRGIPDARVVQGEYNPSAAFNLSLKEFFSNLQSFKFKGRNLTNTTLKIASVTALGVLTVTVPFAFSAGQVFQTIRARNDAGTPLSGFVTVLSAIDSVSCQLVAWDGGLTHVGSVRQVTTPVYVPFVADLVDVGRIVVRKVGRPFAGYRGRRSSSRRHQQTVVAP